MAGASLLPPGSTIGILGGGQLGRMLATAAARLGLKACVLSPETDSPARAVAASAIVADYADAAALDAFAARVDVVTYEFENIPVAAVERLAAIRPVRPGAKALRLTQDRLDEKRFLNGIGLATAPFAAIHTAADLAAARERLGAPAILKSRRLGYDGKGQARIHAGTEPDAAWAAIGASPAILEGFVRFAREISVVAARGLDGRTACFDPAENLHRDHILHTSRVPAAIDGATAAAARDIAERILAALDYVGVLGVELFVTGTGDLVVNEIAPRVHNSGHWTLDACVTSQFEQHIRAICGWPLGTPARHSDAEMVNLIGSEVDEWPALAAEPGAALHLYGKAAARPGRKMGHVTRLYPLGSPQGSAAEAAAGGAAGSGRSG